MDKRLVLFFLFYWFTIDVAFPHSGRTDKNGGHHDRIHGGYHYHHGMPAHDHPNGICPYTNTARGANDTVTTSGTRSIHDENDAGPAYGTGKSKNEHKGAGWMVKIIVLVLVALLVRAAYHALAKIYRNRKE